MGIARLDGMCWVLDCILAGAAEGLLEEMGV